MKHFEGLLKGGDLRSIGNSNKAASLVDSQESFDELFEQLSHPDRKVVMRAADAIEKLTLTNATYLKPHKKAILKLYGTAENKELKWHLALLAPRLILSKQEHRKVWQILSNWAKDKKESRIVRVNSLQGLHNLLNRSAELKKDFNLTLSEIEEEGIASLNARIRKLKRVKR